MAFRIRHWLMGVGAGLGLVAVWTLPPDPPEDFQRRARTASQIRAEGLSQSVTRANETLKRLRWGDSLTALAAGHDPGTVFWATPSGSEPSEEEARRFLDRIEFELANAPARDPDMRLGFILQPRHHASHPEVGSPGFEPEMYLGTREGVPYCLTVVTSGSRGSRLTRSFAGAFGVPPGAEEATDYDLLRLCRLPARYGVPGQGIMTWLQAGGMRLGVEAGRERYETIYLQPDVTSRLDRGLRPQLWVRDVAVDQCLTGSETACASLLSAEALSEVIHPTWAAVAAATRMTYLHEVGRTAFGFFDLFILSDLEEEFGHDRFRVFWTSDKPFDAAFEDAFGSSTGVWMRSWAQRTIGTYQAGPRPTKRAGLGSLLFLTLCAGLAGITNRRRKVA